MHAKFGYGPQIPFRKHDFSFGNRNVEDKPERVEARMPVDKRTIQPFGLLHGGASAALAETIGSVGAHEAVKESGAKAVGLELNINHLKSATSDYVYGVGEPIHKGRKTHVWDVKIRDTEGSLVAVARLTVMILPGK